MSSEPVGTAADVHALIQDLLPLLLPRARFDAGAGEVVLPVGPAEPRAVTTTIVRECARVPRHEWPRLVEEWLLSVSDRAALAIGEIELLGDVRKRLRVRIVPRMPDDRRADLVLAEFGPFFDAMVVIEHPRYSGPLTAERASRLQLRDLGQAVDNTLERELIGVTVTERPLSMTASVRFITKPGSRYVSAALTDLARYLPRPCPYGALVGVPSHDKVLLYAARSAADRSEVASVLTEVVAEMHDASDDPCSRHVFWWHGGGLRPVHADDALPPELEKFAVRFRPPDGRSRAGRPAHAARRLTAAVRSALRRLV